MSCIFRKSHLVGDHPEAPLFRLCLEDVSAYPKWTVVSISYFAEQEVIKVLQMEVNHLAIGTEGAIAPTKRDFLCGRDICLVGFNSVLRLCGECMGWKDCQKL